MNRFLGRKLRRSWAGSSAIFDLRLEAQALKFLKDLNKKDAARIRAALELLRLNPIPPKALKLSNRDGYRVRVGKFRIIYSFKSENLTIRVIKIAQRQSVYKH